MTTSTLVYSSGSGFIAPEFASEPEPQSYWADMDWCGVCHRATDHFGEHDDMIAAGLAAVDEDGYLVRTAAWSDDVARLVADAGFEAYQRGEATYRGFLAGLTAFRTC